MKVFFDTNVYVAEALFGEVAEQLLEATEQASWRIYASLYLLDELECVLTEKLDFSRRLANLSGADHSSGQACRTGSVSSRRTEGPGG